MAQPSLLIVGVHNRERRSAGRGKEFLGRGAAGRCSAGGIGWVRDVVTRNLMRREKMEANRRIGARWRTPRNEDL